MKKARGGSKEAGSVLRLQTISGEGNDPLTCVCFSPYSLFSASVSFQADSPLERLSREEEEEEERTREANRTETRSAKEGGRERKRAVTV